MATIIFNIVWQVHLNKWRWNVFMCLLMFKRHNIDSFQCNTLFNICSLNTPIARDKTFLCHEALLVSLIQQNFEAIALAFLEAGD